MGGRPHELKFYAAELRRQAIKRAGWMLPTSPERQPSEAEEAAGSMVAFRR
jgi:hypothetical protein